MTDYTNQIGAKFLTSAFTGTKELSPTDQNPAIFMNTAVSSPYTNNAWQTLDLSQHVPVGTKWARLTGVLIITNPVNDEVNITLAFRKPGETYDYGYLLQGYSDPMSGCRETCDIVVPVDSNRHVEFKPNWYANTQTWPAYPSGPAWGLNLQVTQFGYGDASTQPPAESTPSYHIVFNPTMNLNGSGMQNMTVVTAPPGPFSNSATKVKVSLAPNFNLYGNTTILNCWIGKKAASGDAYDFDGNQVRVTFGGANGCTLTQGGSLITSDEITISLANTDNILVACDMGNTPAMGAGSSSGAVSYYKLSGSDAATTNKTGYTAVSGYSYLVGKIEFYQ